MSTRWIRTLRSSAMLACLCACPLSLAAQKESEPNLANRLDRMFADWNRPDRPGVAVTVIEQGKVIYSRGFGSANLEHGVPIGRGTVFNAASVSKQFTAMAVTMLAAKGELSLDDPVQKYLPWMPQFKHPITVRQLIHHTSGLRDQGELAQLAGWGSADSSSLSAQQFRALVRHQTTLNFEPGSQFLYSNTGYTLLAEIVEAVSGRSLREFTEREIFAPLGMSHSHFHDDAQMLVSARADSYAQGENEDIRLVPSNSALPGASDLLTTADDLARWLDNFRQKSVGGEEVLNLMKASGKLNSGTVTNYAGGLGVGRYRGFDIVTHSGATAGFRSFTLWFEQPAVGIVVLSNFSTVNAPSLGLKVAEVVLAQQFSEPAPVPATVATATAALDQPGHSEDFVGSYRLDRGYLVEIKPDGDQLVAVVLNTKYSVLREPGDTLWLKSLNARLTLKRSEAGKVLGVTVVSPTEVTEGVKLQALKRTSTELASYAGTYYSRELETIYRIVARSGALIIEHPSRGECDVQFISADEIVSQLLPTGVFRRDANGQIRGLYVSAGRIRDVYFDKLSL